MHEIILIVIETDTFVFQGSNKYGSQRGKKYPKDVLKANLQTSILDILQPKFNAPFKISIQVVLNTTTVGSSKRW